jgi:cytidine deaminase
MVERNLITKVDVYRFEELSADYKKLVDEAKKQTAFSYAPYSTFQVGAAVLLENGEVVAANNQENSAYPSGLCAERVAMFYANARYPDVAPKAIAIAAYTADAFLKQAVAPCGACRQVLLETETRYGKEIEVLLYGENEVLAIKNIKSLLPLTFNKESLGK